LKICKRWKRWQLIGEGGGNVKTLDQVGPIVLLDVDLLKEVLDMDFNKNIM
jgi:hypothetical protein